MPAFAQRAGEFERSDQIVYQETLMKTHMQICVRALVFTALFLAIARPAWAANGFIIVGNEPANCPDAQFTTIQAALNAAAPGQRIHLCRGTYPEQLKITKPVHIDSANGVVLLPTNMQANTTSLVSGAPIAAAILVMDTTNVIIEGMIVDGINNNVSACAPQLIGIEYQNASGVVENVTVRNFKLAAALNGCQSGTAIFVQSGGGGASELEVHDSVLYDYQKNGITANEAGTAITVHDNFVTGVGPTSGAAQNGIQVGFGAGGEIRRNTVTNNIWSPCLAVDNCASVGVGILVEQSDSVRITGNNVGVSQVGIFISGNDATLRQNQVFAANVFDGIRIEGNGNRLEKNEVATGPEAGILLEGNNNVVLQNTITGAGIGIFKDTGLTGNLIVGNSVFSSLIRMQDPELGSLKQKVVADR